MSVTMDWLNLRCASKRGSGVKDDPKDVPVSAIEQLRRQQRLPVRLKREVPWSTETGCAIFVGLFVLAWVGGFYYAATILGKDEKDVWVVYVFIGVFGFVGALLVLSGIHRLIASRVRETIVEIDTNKIVRGEVTRICFRQEGPVTLTSLRANMLCFERTHTWGRRTDSNGNSESYRKTDEKLVYQQNILDEHQVVIAAEEIWETQTEFQLPAEALRSVDSDDREVVWKIEVWGKVAWWPDFMHPFVVHVV